MHGSPLFLPSPIFISVSAGSCSKAPREGKRCLIPIPGIVGGLEQTGILELIAGFIAKISGSNAMRMLAIVLWISAIASAFVDNIPFAATMVPVIKSLAAALE